jgi:DNA-binding XRE family transcriptional regulator
VRRSTQAIEIQKIEKQRYKGKSQIAVLICVSFNFDYSSMELPGNKKIANIETTHKRTS